MNIHPFIVHFPIALLFVYIFFEFAEIFFKKEETKNFINRSKLTFLVLGALATIPALLTGDLASEIIGENKFIETHEAFATLTSVYFLALSTMYVWPVIKNTSICSAVLDKLSYIKPIFVLLDKLSDFLKIKTVQIIVALAGFVLLSITGALGAGIAHGVNADFIVSFIYKLLF